MRVPSREKNVAESLQVRMRHDRIHEDLAGASPAMLRKDEHVTDPAERRPIGHGPRERDLRRAGIGISFERREADRCVDRAVKDLPRDTDRPVGVVVQEAEYELAINMPRIARNDVLPHARRV